MQQAAEHDFLLVDFHRQELQQWNATVRIASPNEKRHGSRISELSEELLMVECNTMEVDLTKELRLRRWARENYVPETARSATWHPVVLNEMRMKDAELAVREQNRLMNSQYVPLPPMMAPHRLDEAHSLPQPNLLQLPQEAEKPSPSWV